jgi:hypothetical protein
MSKRHDRAARAIQKALALQKAGSGGRLPNEKRRSGWRGSAAAKKPHRFRLRASQLNHDDGATVAVRDEYRLRFIRLLATDMPTQPLALEPVELIRRLEQRGVVAAELVEAD